MLDAAPRCLRYSGSLHKVQATSSADLASPAIEGLGEGRASRRRERPAKLAQEKRSRDVAHNFFAFRRDWFTVDKTAGKTLLAPKQCAPVSLLLRPQHDRLGSMADEGPRHIVQRAERRERQDSELSKQLGSLFQVVRCHSRRTASSEVHGRGKGERGIAAQLANVLGRIGECKN